LIDDEMDTLECVDDDIPCYDCGNAIPLCRCCPGEG